jgi:NodT family efflux transporter outer membrane factor (OMF) lipoprotein
MSEHSDVARRRPASLSRGVAGALAMAVLAGCAVGPNYVPPKIAVPDHFREAVTWQRARADTYQALRDTWWRSYDDPVLDGLVEHALKANQSIVAAQAAYRAAQAEVQASAAALHPTVSAGLAASHNGQGPAVPRVSASSGSGATYNLVSADVAVTWEPDLWGSVRRSIEAAKAEAQASDAQLAGMRLSIAASVVADYFALRQADADIESLREERDIDARLLTMTRGSQRAGAASNNQVLEARDIFDATVTTLQALQAAREQDEHALAALLGTPPEAFSLAPQPDYAFVVPTIPPTLPSQLLERRYDVVIAERTAAAANARIGVAEAAFFPSLGLSAQGGFESSTFAHLLSLPDRLWTLGPALAATLFDGGARQAAVASARATYDEDVALYRNAVIAAFQSVEDSLSAVHHLRRQAEARARILRRNAQLYASAKVQRQVGASSEHDLLGIQLALLQARQNVVDAQAALSESSVTLVKNLGGGWQWKVANEPAARAADNATPTRSDQ